MTSLPTLGSAACATTTDTISATVRASEAIPTCRHGTAVGGLCATLKLLVDGFTIKTTRADQELRVLVHPPQ
ncbi:hypothetical protein FKN01_06535 [Streptomyces sp. 130]|nr:hypothetical protein FKN01_06535 [Streptomyces sp. 130]